MVEAKCETQALLVAKCSSGTDTPRIMGAYKRRQVAERLALLLTTRAQANSGLDQE